MSPRRKPTLPKIRELTESNEIFSVDILMNKRYNASVISFKNSYIFSSQLNLDHVSLRRNKDFQTYEVQS